MNSKGVVAIEMQEFHRQANNRSVRIKNEARQFTQSVSLIGVTHATDMKRSKGRRYVWMIWLFFGVGLAIYQIQDRIVYYLSYPYNTEFHVHNENQLRFPQVTICKESWASRTKANEFGIDKSFVDFIELMQGASDVTNETLSSFLESLGKTVAELRNQTIDWDIISRNISFSWEELVTTVTWNGIRRTDLAEDAATDVGHCFAISTEDNPLISRHAGIRSGLELYLDAKQADSLHMLSYNHGIFDGFRVLLHDPLETPRMQEAGIVISPGTVTQIALSFTNVTHIGPPYHECNTDFEYRIETCLAECEDKYFFEQCKCRPFYRLKDNDTNSADGGKVCDLFDHSQCLYEFKTERSENEQLCDCGQQCYTQSFGYSLSQSRISPAVLPFFEQKSLAINTSQKGSSSSFGPDVTVVFIYYPSLTYTNIVAVEAYTFLALLCDVGGALSLLLGATLLTIYEVAEFLAIVVTDYICLRTEPKNGI